MAGGATSSVEAFVDWENIRRRLADNYVERVTVRQVMDAIERVAKEVGDLKMVTFYGDFTLRRDDAREIHGKAKFDYRSVLRSPSGRDRTDATMIPEILEAAIRKGTGLHLGLRGRCRLC